MCFFKFLMVPLDSLMKTDQVPIVKKESLNLTYTPYTFNNRIGCQLRSCFATDTYFTDMFKKVFILRDMLRKETI